MSVAEYEKRWQIRGKSANKNKLAFIVQAFDYTEAKRKAKTKLKPGDTIEDLVLSEPKKNNFYENI